MWAKREDNSRSRAPFPSEGSRAMSRGMGKGMKG